MQGCDTAFKKQRALPKISDLAGISKCVRLSDIYRTLNHGIYARDDHMSQYFLAVILTVCTAIFPICAQAQEWTFGVGATDYGNDGDDSAAFEVEYRYAPFMQRRVMSLSWGANGSASTEGDLFIGGGIWARWHWQNGWFIDSSIMPGLYDEGTSDNDLGSAFEIRSLLGVGYQLESGAAVSVAITHKSNAGLASENPGSETYLLRYHMSF